MQGAVWDEFVKTVPKPPAAAAPATAATALSSPLKGRLERKANRSGDGVPYGTHGPWGMFREGCKEMTDRVKNGELTAEEARQQLEEVGVRISARVLERKAKSAPGESPIKAGTAPKISKAREEKLAGEVRFIRAHDIPYSMCMIKAHMDGIIKGTPDEQAYPQGVTDEWYYRWLDAYDMSSGNTKPLESERDLWLTSTVHSLPYSPPCPTPPTLPYSHDPTLCTLPFLLVAERRGAVCRLGGHRRQERDGRPQPQF